MNRTLRTIVPVLLLAPACLVLKADTFARLTGVVTDNNGQPVSGAKVQVSRMDRDWTKEITTNKKGVWLIAGLDATDYTITVSAPGFASYKFKMKAPLGDVAKQDIKLLTVAQNGGAQMVDATNGTPVVQAAPKEAPPADPAAQADSEARTAFNTAVPLWKAGQTAQALPLLKEAYEKIGLAVQLEASRQDKNGTAAVPESGDDSASVYPQIARTYGAALVKTGDKETAIPVLEKAVDLAPSDKASAGAAKGLVDIFKEKKDSANAAKYQAVLDKLVGPDPSSEYNAAVEAFNAGKMKTAKERLMKTVEIDPKFPDSYYLLGIVDYALGNTAASKQNFKKYLELAPDGKHAQEVKQTLATY